MNDKEDTMHPKRTGLIAISVAAMIISGSAAAAEQQI